MAPPPTSHPATPPERPSLQVQHGLLDEIFLPATVMAPSSDQTPPPPSAPFITDIPEALLEDIFLRLPTAADLARASTARASFRRVIAGYAFLRRYRALHPPPLVGMLYDPFISAQPPHPSAVPARAFAGFDFSSSSFLPSTAGRSWRKIGFFDGRALLAGTPDEKRSGRRFLMGFKVCDSHYRDFLVRDLAVSDPVHRHYVLLPTVPDDLKVLIRRPDLLSLETFLAPGEDEKDPLSFRVVCLAQCRMNLLLLVFSSLHGQWHVRTYDQWSARATLASFENAEPGLSKRQFVHGCFYWHLHFRNKLLVFDVRAMEFSAVDLPLEQRGNSFVIVEAAIGMLGMLTQGCDEGSEDEDDSYWLKYSILSNNQWHLEKVIPLPLSVKCANLVDVAGGYLLIEALYTTSSQEKPKFGYFSVDVKTLQMLMPWQRRVDTSEGVVVYEAKVMRGSDVFACSVHWHWYWRVKSDAWIGRVLQFLNF